MNRAGLNNDSLCPSSKRCLLTGSDVPCTFLKGKKETILHEAKAIAEIAKKMDTEEPFAVLA